MQAELPEEPVLLSENEKMLITCKINSLYIYLLLTVFSCPSNNPLNVGQEKL